MSKAFGLGILEIPKIDLGKTKGSKPRMVGTIGVPFSINPGDGSATVGNAKTKRVKPSMVGIVCPFFGVGTLESTGDSMISLITTKVRGAGTLILEGTLQRSFYKYSSQYFLDPIIIALWLVPAWVLRGIG